MRIGITSKKTLMLRHLGMASLSALLVYLFYLSYSAWGVQPALWPDWGQDHPYWRAWAHAAFVLLFVVYYNLVTAMVARREELVLKRLRTSQATDADILAGAAVPALAVAVVQVLIVTVAAVALLDLGVPVNPVLIVIGLLGGAAVFVLLAALSTPFTRNVETAQITTMPALLVNLLFSGLTFPLDVFPDTLATAARLVPLTPVVELFLLGLEGAVASAPPVSFAETFAEAVVPVGVLLAWIVVGVYGVRRWFRWEPRN